MKKSLIALATVALALTAYAQDTKVAIGISGWTGFAPLTLALQTGLFKKQGLDVSIKKIPQKDRHLAIASGDIQTLFLEEAGLQRECERREAGPAADADGDLGLLGVGRQCKGDGGQCDQRLLHASSSWGLKIQMGIHSAGRPGSVRKMRASSPLCTSALAASMSGAR